MAAAGAEVKSEREQWDGSMRQSTNRSAPDEKALVPILAAKDAAKVGHLKNSVLPSNF
jgi:hypothetical protein